MRLFGGLFRWPRVRYLLRMLQAVAVLSTLLIVALSYAQSTHAYSTFGYQLTLYWLALELILVVAVASWMLWAAAAYKCVLIGWQQSIYRNPKRSIRWEIGAPFVPIFRVIWVSRLIWKMSLEFGSARVGPHGRRSKTTNAIASLLLQFLLILTSVVTLALTDVSVFHQMYVLLYAQDFAYGAQLLLVHGVMLLPPMAVAGILAQFVIEDWMKTPRFRALLSPDRT